MLVFAAALIGLAAIRTDFAADPEPGSKERAEVLTEFIGDSTLEEMEAKTITDADIYRRDMALLEEADAIVAECSTPSLGVGYELGRAEALGLPVYILYRPKAARRLSAMIAGNGGFRLMPYHSREEAETVLGQILEELEQEGGVVRTPAALPEEDDQISLLDLRSQQVCDALAAITVETLTPIEAMNELYKLKKMLN